MIRNSIRNLVIGFAVGSLGLALAVAIPNAFSTGTVISSGAVNANFTAIRTAVDTLEAKVATLEATKSLPARDAYYAYAWIEGLPGSPPLNQNTSFNPAGAITVSSPTVGSFTVAFQGVHPEIRNVQVTQYQGGATPLGICRVATWGGASVIVKCYNSTGGLVDTGFLISVSN
jgi:outer membrane murein-binding lipoprotein Lpp